MEINYKKVDFIKWDFQLLLFCLFALIFLWISGEIIFIRIFLPIFIKKNTKVLFLKDELTVLGKRIKKEI